MPSIETLSSYMGSRYSIGGKDVEEESTARAVESKGKVI